jgi:arylsulfatase A-like enzyme
VNTRILQPRSLATTLILLLIAGCAEPGSRAPETNVILITLDTVRADHLSCYGYPRATTPNLDSFARSSTWYTNAQTTAPWTLPAHASLFTGLYPPEHGAQMVLPGPELRGEEQFRQALSLDGDFATLAEVMGGLGYDTAGVASNFLYLDTAYNLHRGFEHYEVLPGVVDQRAARARQVNRKALDWLRGRGAAPFFLFLNYRDAHTPYNTTPQEGFLEQTPAYDRKLLLRVSSQILPPDGPVPDEMLEKVTDQYDLALRNLDDGIGELLDGLRELGLHDETLIIITSDHGEYLGEHRLIEHSKDVYQPALWVPLFVKRPAQRQGTVEERLISLVHLPRLILKEIGADHRVDEALFPYSWPEPQIFAHNKWSLWKDLRRPWGARFKRIRKVVYQGPFKFIESSDGNHELYDVAKDPGESNNLLDGAPDLRDQWLSQIDETWPSGTYDASSRIPEDLTEDEYRRAKALGYISGDDD